jgi:hypothetical protein
MLVTSQATAGSVSSGGGKFIGTEFNPWFLQNVNVVNYCVDVDPSSFRPGREKARQAVSFAINKWVSSFSERMITDPFYIEGELEPYGDVRLATQRFVEVDCGASVKKDLRFQFGTLTADQEKHLPNFKKYIGVAVRTAYDAKLLKGSGFIYIAADSGPNRPAEPDYDADPWSPDGNSILKTVLLHELGHIFGMRHESGKDHVMSDAVVDMIVSREFVQATRKHPGMMEREFLTHLNVMNYNPNMVLVECSQYSVEALTDLLYLDHGTKCVKMAFSHNEQGMNKLRIRILSAPAESGPYYEEGTMTSVDGFSGQARPFIELKISDKQKVFTKLPNELWGNRLYAGYEKVTSRRFKATYLNDAGQKREHLFGHIDDKGDFRLGVFRDGELDLQVYKY